MANQYLFFQRRQLQRRLGVIQAQFTAVLGGVAIITNVTRTLPLHIQATGKQL